VIAAVLLTGPAALSQQSVTGNIAFDKACYIVGKDPTATMTGSSFAPNASIEVVLKNRETVVQDTPLTTDAAGGFTLSLPNPGVPVSAEVLDAGNGDLQGVQLAAKTLNATKFEAGYTFGVPHRGPTRVKDTMVLAGSGFAGGQQSPRGGPESLYLHRVGPRGYLRTELLSKVRTCGFGGTNRVTGRALFLGGGPKAKFAPGRWTFQFDTSSRYRRSTKEKIALRLRVTRRGTVTPGEHTKVG
jgi:hypothetical protein